MNKKEVKVEKFLQKQLTNENTLNLLLLQVSDNSYILFGKYHITKTNSFCYEVEIEDTNIKKTFNTLKTAVTWCVFNIKKKTQECKQIENIDFKLASLDIDIQQKTKVLNATKDEDFKFVYMTKIEEDNIKKQMLLKKLNRFINTSKDWQTKKFNDAKSRYKR